MGILGSDMLAGDAVLSDVLLRSLNRSNASSRCFTDETEGAFRSNSSDYGLLYSPRRQNYQRSDLHLDTQQ
jgi:hypothetical protein